MNSVSIVVTSYSMERLDDIRDLLRSIKDQTDGNYELVYVTERDRNLEATIWQEAKDIGLATTIVHNEGRPGLAEARNLGASVATGEILGFVDDDVFLNRKWIGAVRKAFQLHQDVFGITGPVHPFWIGTPADWLPNGLDWLIGCTRWFDSDEMTEVPNCWGMNMAFRRYAFLDVGGFSVESTERSRYLRTRSSLDLGKDTRQAHGKTAEDVDISLRLRKSLAGKLCYVPEMMAYSKVYDYRLSKRFIIQRSSWIGYSRRNFSQASQELPSLSSFEDKLIPKVLLSAVDIRGDWQVNLRGVGKRYRTLLLSLFCLLYGYVAGPIE